MKRNDADQCDNMTSGEFAPPLGRNYSVLHADEKEDGVVLVGALDPYSDHLLCYYASDHESLMD